ncbi:MAG: c-type cytochrome [Chloroflexota bacterium]|nr:c-type cytochrome [Chloroflexota bacterium]MDE3192081.1 c-type cytochrome [Chloroflexota bacterium]
MSARSSAPYAPGTPRVSYVVPRAIAAFVLVVSLTLLIAGATGPYTHSNLDLSYDSAYTRTDQVVVGAPVPYGGVGGAVPASADQVATGERLFVTEGCVTCHGLEGQGGVVGPAIAGVSAAAISDRVHKGPEGMPRFAETLTDADIAAISAYLRSVPAPKSGTP